MHRAWVWANVALKRSEHSSKAGVNRVRLLPIRATVACGFCVLLQGCSDRESVPKPIDASLTRTMAPADRDVGRKDFASYCLACHGNGGQGSDSGPPIAESPWVAGPPNRLIRIVLHGVRGPIDAGGGITYNREMPGFGPILSDERIADLVTYVRRNFGGSSGAIAAETVAEIRIATRDRTAYWTAEELLAESP
jgi:mono/diheme cytochrome c family protein